MKITKDQARILADALRHFDLLEEVRSVDGLLGKLKKFEEKLREYGKDKRRIGRTAQDDWSDLIKRFALKN